MQEFPSSPVDGIVPPTQEAPLAVSAQDTSTSSVDTSKKSKEKRMLIVFALLSLLYALPGLTSLSVFPRPDGSLGQVKIVLSFLYGIGAVFWLLFGIIGYSRIAKVKDRPKTRLIALLRLGGFSIPLFFVSTIVAVLINLPPKLYLNVISPTTSAEFVAPLSVTFAMDDALLSFKAKQLTPLKYNWDYNNDGVMDQETFDPQSTYFVTKAGIYNIVVVVTMTNGVTKNVVYRLVVPRSSFGLQPNSPIVDEPVTFSLEHLFPKTADTSIPKLLKAKWDFDGDGNVDLETDKLLATHTYHKLGSTNVMVTMTLTNQSQSSLQRVIEIVEPPSQPFPIVMETEPTTLLGSPPFGVLFSLNTKEPIVNVSWDFGNGKTAEGLRVAQVFSEVGTYVITANARSESGAVARLNKVVRVTSPLEIRDLTFIGSPEVKGFSISGEVPLTIDLTPNTIQPLITFSWDAPSATELLTTDKSFHAVYRDPGKYFIDLIGIDPDQNVFRKRISVDAKPTSSQASFTMDPETPIAPALVKFDASDTFVPSDDDITGFEWDFGDGQSNQERTKFSGTRIDHLFENPGTYTITLTVRTTTGKVFSGKRTLVVRAPLVDACFLPSRRSGKAPLGVRFETSCSTGQFNTWLWDFGDTSQSDQQNPTHVFLDPGEYTVTLTATTPTGQTSVKTTTISATSE